MSGVTWGAARERPAARETLEINQPLGEASTMSGRVDGAFLPNILDGELAGPRT